MAARDTAAIAGGVSEATLVDRAGGAVARGARRLLGGTYGRRVVIVCGKGNNGADGRVAGRRLAGWGARVDRFDLDRDRPRRRCDRALRPGRPGRRRHVRHRLPGRRSRATPPSWPSAFDGRGLPGPGGRHPVGRRRAHRRGARHRPSRPHATVCLRRPQARPRASSRAPQLAGDVEVADIGIDPGHARRHRSVVTEQADVAAWLPRRRPPRVTSGRWGASTWSGGSQGMTGAVMLAAGAALRAGAGIVVAGLPGDAAGPGLRRRGHHPVAARPPPPAPSTRTPSRRSSTGSTASGPSSSGPASGRSAPTVAAVRRLVAEAPVPLVLDADGLNALGGDLDLLAARPAGHRRDPPRRGVRPPGRRAGGRGPRGRRPAPGRTGRGRRAAQGEPDGGGRSHRAGRRQRHRRPVAGHRRDGRRPLRRSSAPWRRMGLPAFRAAAAGAWLHGRAARLRRPRRTGGGRLRPRIANRSQPDWSHDAQ